MRSKSLHKGARRAVALLAAVGLLALPAAAFGDNARLTIVPEQGGFFGYLHSSKHSCELNRTVKLFKVKKHGNKKLIGTDEAQPNGPDSQWNVNTDKSGKFFAKVAAKGSCEKVVSDTEHSEG